ncbi:TraR/DksA family transcriptional regulator [Actinomadura macrotermitis]|uniref:RNA polymerase-binding transcription factor DksA n=1 Tax=Actinomadura macrotermitis TaxID=2585200 RepID=A0A7K0BQF9_9ACTN|nr:RNA polymerase-binding transcription factor DksA [Actinomadura macrotermitis]
MDDATPRSRLETMLAELDRSIAILKGEHPGREASAADAGTNLTDSDRVEAALTSMERHRAAVLAALARLDEGSYGRCAGCGKPVPEGRLEARPDAARCVPCQARHDRAMR